ncbi:hypothetical protein MVLG_01210 [Microbotryum lychnidis-dioicae p1A1 Lamole]|uniref:HNH nuclease domain-containing protein n=1 Tax=Microbotryum lychnidis-dioicae (strain p1A1 Lamole / MvSl-1064) TaxID=683840 RepID=U5H1F4_USTV1|nr:hypothetical protein MVLG_01210 [Microbotryum lychnidis-dioicae p1A1 Lamole]|eukprot:KDE08757.1 hypothetical protein MVLG_01210 [Microbotryum lychnidis-dioicae p1A1 Lamole]
MSGTKLLGLSRTSKTTFPHSPGQMTTTAIARHRIPLEVIIGQYAHDAQIAHDGRINDHLIVPTQVWAHFGVEQPYGASCGITLSPDLHAMYQRYAFSFYPNGCDIYYRFHGKEISREAFHTVNDREIPFDEYFRWHYAQCVMLHLRGTTADQ